MGSRLMSLLLYHHNLLWLRWCGNTGLTPLPHPPLLPWTQSVNHWGNTRKIVLNHWEQEHQGIPSPYLRDWMSTETNLEFLSFKSLTRSSHTVFQIHDYLYACFALTQPGCHVPTKAALPPPSATGQDQPTSTGKAKRCWTLFVWNKWHCASVQISAKNAAWYQWYFYSSTTSRAWAIFLQFSISTLHFSPGKALMLFHS